MKKFLLGQILTSTVAITASYIGVNSAFVSVDKNYSIPMVNAYKPITPSIEIEVSELEELDFIPATSEEKIEVEDKKIEFTYNKKISPKISELKITKEKNIKAIKSYSKLSYKDIDTHVDKYESIKVTKTAWHKIDYNFDYSKVANTTNESLDRISVAQSAPNRSDNNEELVFFDYSNSNESNDSAELELKTSQKLSQKQKDEPKNDLGVSEAERMALDEAINKAFPKVQQASKKGIQNLGSISKSSLVSKGFSSEENKNLPETLLYKKQKTHREVATISDEAKRIQNSMKANENMQSAFMANQQDDSKDECNVEMNVDKILNFNYKLKAYSLGLSKVDFIHNFEMRFQDDVNEALRDFGTSEIEFKGKISGDYHNRRIILLAGNHYPTAMDLIIEPENLNIEIPMFTKEKFESILEDGQLSGLGGHILVELDQKTEDAELDIQNKYEAKMYLNRDLKVIDRADSDYSYILFVGVKSSNVVLNFRSIKNEIYSKIVHVSDDEIYYEPNFTTVSKKKQITLFEETPLTSCKGMLSIAKTEINEWSRKLDKKKENLNTIRFAKHTQALGMRNYFVLSHLEEEVIIGNWNNNKIIVPSEAYINYAVSQFDHTGSENQCMVQLNFNKKIQEIAFNGTSNERSMRLQVRVLDHDGKFYDDFSDQSKQAFLMGEEEGLVNIKIIYTDGSHQYLQSYCSAKKYIVEQL